MPRLSTDRDTLLISKGDPRNMGKKSSFHSFVLDQQSLPLHHLVPLASQRRIQPHPADQPTPESGRPTESGFFEPSFSFPKISADSGVDSISEENLSVSGDSEESYMEYPATMSLQKSSYRESISFGVVEPAPKTRCLSVSKQEREPRIKEEVIFGPGLKPVNYQNRLTVSVNRSWRRYKSSVNYEPKMKPVRFSSTCYLRPCYVSQSFVSLLDYRTDDDMKWYQCTLELRPKTYSSAKVGCFEMNNNELQEEEYESDDSEGEQDISVFMDDDGVGLVSPHVVNAKVWDYTDATTAPRGLRNNFGSPLAQPKSHRASITVNGAPQRHSDQVHPHSPKRLYSNQRIMVEDSNGTENLVDFDPYSMGQNESQMMDDFEDGTTDQLLDFRETQQMNGHVNGLDISDDYLHVPSGFGKYVQLDGYGGSNASLEDIDL